MDRDQFLNDTEGAIRTALQSLQSSLWTAIPCIVESINFTTMTIEAQPTIQGIVEDENGVKTNVNMPVLPDVPIVFPSAGGFSLTLPIAVGDEVLVIIASRCIDSWWYNGGIGVPMETRMHDLSDAFAIPGPRSKPRVISSISSSTAQLRNDAGTAYIEIDASGHINIKGNLNVTGNIVASGEVTGAGAITLTTHTHVSATPGSPTGPPVG
jgi:hypothetical protein